MARAGKKTKFARVLFASFYASGCSLKHAPPALDECTLTVFAASSLSDLTEIVRRSFAMQHPECTITQNFGSSNTLGLQIEAGAHADVFLSAAQAPVNRLVASGRLRTGSPKTLFSNRLAVVSHTSNSLALHDVCDLATASFRLLVVGQPDAVPIGTYAKDYLSTCGCAATGPLWDSVQHRLLPMPNARAVLSVVERQADLVGIVYRTDALQSTTVRTLLVIEGHGAPHIDYFGVRLGKQNQAADEFLQLFSSPEVQVAIKRMGFVVGSS